MQMSDPRRSGELHIRAAEKALKTKPWVLKFSIDYDTAATEYINASKCFMDRGEHGRAVDAMARGGECRRKYGDSFGAGRAFESAGTNAINFLKDYQTGCKHFASAAECYVAAGKPDSAVRTYLKVVDIADTKLHDFEKAHQAYQHCINIYDQSDKDHLLVDILKDYCALLARRFLEKREATVRTALQDALAHLLQVQEHLKQSASLAKYVFCKILVELFCLDLPAALRELSVGCEAYSSFVGTREWQAATELLRAWKVADTTTCQQILESSTVMYLPIDFVKFASLLLHNIQSSITNFIKPQSPFREHNHDSPDDMR